MLLDQFKQAGFLHSNGIMNASFVKKLKNNPEWMKELNTYDGESISEKLFLLDGRQKTVCEVCGKPTKFRSFSEGYERFCSAACRKQSSASHRPQLKGAANPETLAKMRATCLSRNGFANPFQQKNLPRGKPNLEKQKATMLERYGVDHVSKIPGISEQKLATFKANYSGKSKAIETNLQRYGVTWATQAPEIIAKIKAARHRNTFETIIKSTRFLERMTPLFSIEEFHGHEHPMRYRCNSCNEEFEASFEDGKLPRCPICFPLRSNSSIAENEIASFVQNLVPSESIIRGDRSILNGKHLDILIPGRKLAIEYNGNYYHAELSAGRGRGYHLEKTLGCEKAGIRLLHIFSDEWIESRPIVESIISSALGVYSNKIGARQLEIAQLPSLASFYDANHIQGRAGSSVNFALIDLQTKEVLAGLSFRKPRFSKKADWEITRFATKLNYSIPGSFSKLLKAFRSKYSGSIITYSERRLFSGKVYLQNGFTALTPSPAGYWYTDDYHRRENRLKFQKHKIAGADPALTEWENMQLLGYDRIWDCGQHVYICSSS